MNEARVWVSLDKKDHDALLQLLERAERQRAARGLTAFIRTLLQDSGLPPVVVTIRRQSARNRQKQRGKVRKRRGEPVSWQVRAVIERLTERGIPPARKNVVAECVRLGINPSTARTEWQRWRAGN